MNAEEYSKELNKSLDDEKKDSIFKKYYIPELFRVSEIHSVIDVGCGKGVLLNSFRERGVVDITGVDVCIDENMLLVPSKNYILFDLSEIDIKYNELKLKTDNKKYDLTCCLEVGDHLPDYCSKSLAHYLVECSDLVFFSAAIPGQCGDSNINEQWPQYWERIFDAFNYIRVDYFRRKFWDEYEIPGNFRQNICLYVNKEKLDSYPVLNAFMNDGSNSMMPLHVVHPTVYKNTINHLLDEFQPNKFPRTELSKKHILHTEVLLNRVEMLKKMPTDGVIAEVGVANGEFSLKMIEILKPKKIYCIDIWTLQERWEGFQTNMKPFIDSGLVEVLKGDSIEMLNKIDDNELDFVYIDAMHDYEHPKRELNLCKNKVKTSGYIAGDDYVVMNIFEDPVLQYGVINAVNEFMVKEDYELLYLTVENLYRTPSYCLRRM